MCVCVCSEGEIGQEKLYDSGCVCLCVCVCVCVCVCWRISGRYVQIRQPHNLSPSALSYVSAAIDLACNQVPETFHCIHYRSRQPALREAASVCVCVCVCVCACACVCVFLCVFLCF